MTDCISFDPVRVRCLELPMINNATNIFIYMIGVGNRNRMQLLHMLICINIECVPDWLRVQLHGRHERIARHMFARAMLLEAN